MSDVGWSVVVPVKALTAAKSRLAPLPAQLRGELALALASDTVSAALGCSSVVAVVVVTDDARATSVLRDLGATVVPDTPDAGLNPALAHGASVAMASRPDAGVVALSADVPAATPAAIDALLRRASAYDRVVVADHNGDGTTALTARPGVALAPAFGPGSLALHVTSGAHPIDGEELLPLRSDVDTLADLERAVALGVGVHTRRLLPQVVDASRR